LRACLGVTAVDRVEAHERVELLLALAVARLAYGAGDGVTLAHAVLADLGEGDVDVVGPREIARGPDEGVVVEDVEDARDRHQDVVLGDLGLRLAERDAVAATAPVAVAVAAPPATTAAAVVLVLVVAVGRGPVLLTVALLTVDLLTVPLLTVRLLTVPLLTVDLLTVRLLTVDLLTVPC
jgi:hypothetical protein